MFTGLSAFPLTPLYGNKVDEKTFISLIENLVEAGVDSIGALGSTGSYAYLTLSERAHVARLAVEHANSIPVMVSIGALRVADILSLAEDAQHAGVSAVMLAPVSYQRPTPDEVYSLYEEVSRYLSVPLCVYDNPATTGFEFSDELLINIANLPSVSSLKLARLPQALSLATQQVNALRSRLPSHVSLGISGDWQAATGLCAGCDVWFSVMGGLFPRTALAITRAAKDNDTKTVQMLSATLEPVWRLFKTYGSLRVTAAAAELLGKVTAPCLPFPLKSLSGQPRDQLGTILEDLKNLI
ncbi:dihydrodipicolinate synthase family protein [Photorhabdus laumondii subsp. laumondii]|uniref:Photorhabdus luminescens subsp. laumondii TTO1 complete genome segment 6/17 n=2 Tax=Photorhabdus laumondii subsp. laumondii TaxID=141679 RepID=Q7N6L9_PHOLL|nr:MULTISPECIES: dihydrodipicolinate synthase family protein [Photorhabdus]AXG46710.1 dihydrodipicolinate synthase family protein [Photorhabdus laumondii subsp. laumondii]KTL61135.1 dihydrodipicolinate synthase [Photorhabdus laumondii subsp. laumondii]MCC8385579.1 dihydrodipicolinate synthase family protein [Photorhabdus laumondii]MCC8414666.1 dihydrodipicolinate synthase family protein [Photorhabdus laumondii]NDK93822.1 dihydrodipicolinate synthase family protein [Photorhabdus laumondii subsp